MSLHPEPTSPWKIFYCYAYQDEDLLRRLDDHLGGLKWDGYIDTWYASKAEAGSVLVDEIYQRLDTADIILLLISPDFLKSEELYHGQMKLAMEKYWSRSARVIPIILRPVVWENTPLNDLKVLPTKGRPVTSWSNRDEAFRDICEGIRDVVTRAPRTIGSPPSSVAMSPIRMPGSDAIAALPASQGPSSDQLTPARLFGLHDGSITDLTGDVFTIGRHSDNHLSVKDPEVSKYHVQIHSQGSGHTIVDVGSANGTTVNGNRLRPHIPAPLVPDAHIVMSERTAFRYKYPPELQPAISTNIHDTAPTLDRGPLTTGDYTQGQAIHFIHHGPDSATLHIGPRKLQINWTARTITITTLCLFTLLVTSLIAYAFYYNFIKIPSDQSAVLTAFCNAIKSQQYQAAYTLLSSGDKRLLTETQFVNVLEGNNHGLKIINCEFNSSLGTITFVFNYDGTITDMYTMVQEDGTWKIDLKIPGHTASSGQRLCPVQDERCRLKIADSALIHLPEPNKIESG